MTKLITDKTDIETEVDIDATLNCGIIMPIAAMSGYTESHWKKVKDIIVDATNQVENYKFKTKIVSDSDGEIDVIHKRIIQNLYNSEVVVCDISGKNPNVLFELGMRLAFDKPTILIKDDNTKFIFDTGVIEHLTYPKSLSYPEIVEFKKELSFRISKTYEKQQSDPDFSTFLHNFGTFKITQLDQEKISDENSVILEELKHIKSRLAYNRNENKNINKRPIIPDNLKDILEDYIELHHDYSDPNILQYKESFLQYLELNDINIDRLPNGALVKYIRDAQGTDDLPF